jgi:hypothetical protein
MPQSSTKKIPTVYCACGCAWDGKHAINNPIIDEHATRGGRCRLITHDEFIAIYHERRCHCTACRYDRAMKRARTIRDNAQRKIDALEKQIAAATTIIEGKP